MKLFKPQSLYKKNGNIIKYFVIFVFFVFLGFFVKAQETIISISILPGEVSRWAASSLSLWEIELAQIQQEVTGRFQDYFWVSDLKWHDNGYNTMIVSDGLIGPNENILTGIYLMAGNGGRPELEIWIDWEVMINQLFSGDYHSIYWDPITYIYRTVWANNWKINKYRDRPWIKIVVPPYTSPGTYSGTIYFDVPGN